MTANPGRVFRVGGTSAEKGHYDSDILDAANTATWGTLRWTASTPAGTSVTLADAQWEHLETRRDLE